MVSLKRCEEILNAIVQEYTADTYQPNGWEKFGEFLISPFKSCAQASIESGNTSLFYKIVKVIMTPLAFIGACFKQVGEEDNPGSQLYKEIIATHIEYEKLIRSASGEYFLFEIEAFNGINFEIHKAMLGYYGDLNESFQTSSGVMTEIISPSSLFFLYHFFEKHPEFESLLIVERWINPFRSIITKLEEYEEGTEIDIDQECESIMQFAYMIGPTDNEWHEEIEILLDYIKTETANCSLIKKIDRTIVKTYQLHEQLARVYTT